MSTQGITTANDFLISFSSGILGVLMILVFQISQGHSNKKRQKNMLLEIYNQQILNTDKNRLRNHLDTLSMTINLKSMKTSEEVTEILNSWSYIVMNDLKYFEKIELKKEDTTHFNNVKSKINELENYSSKYATNYNSFVGEIRQKIKDAHSEVSKIGTSNKKFFQSKDRPDEK